MKLTRTLLALGIAGLPLTAASASDDGHSCPSSRTAHAPGEKDVVATAVAAGDFTTLVKAVQAAHLVEALQGEGPFTVFAPTDAAFARIPEQDLARLLQPENRARLASILTFHVVPGRLAAADVVKLSAATTLNGQRFAVETSDAGVKVGGARVIATDIECSNGIVHVVDSVLVPATQDVVGTAVAAGTFETLAAALGAGGLVEALEGEGPFTVFAPTDAAFAALPEGTVESLLRPESRDRLVEILKYHVIPGRVYADQLAAGHVETLAGTRFEVRLEDAGVFVDAARVTATDVEATNGVIHVVDRVLLP